MPMPRRSMGRMCSSWGSLRSSSLRLSIALLKMVSISPFSSSKRKSDHPRNGEGSRTEKEAGR